MSFVASVVDGTSIVVITRESVGGVDAASFGITTVCCTRVSIIANNWSAKASSIEATSIVGGASV